MEPSCLQILNKVRSYKINAKVLTNLGVEICERLGVHHYEVSLQFIGPASMRTLNKQYRNKDKSTDVLSFPQYSWKKPLKVTTGKLASAKRRVLNPMPLGDIVISLADADKNAKDSGHGLDHEVCFLMIHGMLHLVGHDHMKPNDEKIMFKEQDKLMNCFLQNGAKSKARFYRCVTRSKKER